MIRQLVERALEAVEAGAEPAAAAPARRRARAEPAPAPVAGRTAEDGRDRRGPRRLRAQGASSRSTSRDKGFGVTDCGTQRPRRRRLPGLRPRRRAPGRDRRLRGGHRHRRRRDRLRDGRQQGSRRARGERPRHLDGPQRARAQLRQRADARRPDDRRGPGPRDRRHVPRHPVGRRAARQARRQDHRDRAAVHAGPSQRNPRDDRPARRPRPADRGDHPPGDGRPCRAPVRRPAATAELRHLLRRLRGPLRAQGRRRWSPAARRASATAGEAGNVPADLARYIDHTLLKPDATAADIDKLCAEAVAARVRARVHQPGLGPARRRRTSRAPGVPVASRHRLPVRGHDRRRSRPTRRARSSATAPARSTW